MNTTMAQDDGDFEEGIVLKNLAHVQYENNMDNGEYEDGNSDGDPRDEEALIPTKPAENDEKSAPSMKLFFLVAWVTFLGEMSRGLVIPVLWPYLQVLQGTIGFLGIVSAAFSFSRFFAAPFFGWWSNKRSHKEVMLICLVLLFIGNTIYALYPPPWVLLVSRIIIGLGAGTLGQSRGYVAQVTSKGDQRTRFMAYLTVSQFAGFAVTPGISVLLSYMDFDVFGLDALEADMYSSAGYLMAILSLITFVVVYFVFRDPPSDSPKENNTSKKVSESIWLRTKGYVRLLPSEVNKSVRHPEAAKILLFSTLIFATRTAVAVVETSSSDITNTNFQWGTQTLSYFMCGLGVVGTIVLIALPSICKKLGKLGEGVLLCVGVFSLAFGMILMVPWQHKMVDQYTFVVGLGFTWSLGSALCQTLIITFLSRVLSSDSQGAVMGWLASLGSISRIIGGLWTGLALGGKGGPIMALGMPSGLMFLCLLGTASIVYKTARGTLKF